MSGPLLRWMLARVLPGPDPCHGPARLTIIRHHRVYAVGARPLYALGVDEEVFAGQVATCAAAGLLPVTVAEGLAWLATATRGQRVAFSFDDGYEDNITRALPILQRHGARASFFLAAGLMEERRAPWWDRLAHALEHGRAAVAEVPCGAATVRVERHSPAGRRLALRALLPLLRVRPEEQARRLAALERAVECDTAAPCALADWATASRLVAAGMEVGAHTLGHPFLSLLSAAEQAAEIAGSVRLITERLRAPVVGLAYPNGDHDEVTVAAARAAGLAWAVTTRSGDVRAGAEPFRLVRRGLPAGAVIGPDGRHAPHMTRAELAGRFDRWRTARAEAAS